MSTKKINNINNIIIFTYFKSVYFISGFNLILINLNIYYMSI